MALKINYLSIFLCTLVAASGYSPSPILAQSSSQDDYNPVFPPNAPPPNLSPLPPSVSNLKANFLRVICALLPYSKIIVVIFG